ncbi:diguanylate cyclase (GGDEF)-like protein [Parvibaculum indicum]|uniref:diguanylate cyclase n=1 Tax=Parvibaculum indicum TaxID=562969 RepID=UPI0014210861|nr:diguanylate cyclase [Parvibaculum indicum]NIJ43053.1 diguanylate cyclase (GGDEF)-like protein [Parvibaculum indicum]
MQPSDTPKDEIRKAINILDQELFNHSLWMDTLQMTLVCRLRPDDRDLAADAYRRCRFGQWYYGEEGQPFRSNQNFIELEAAHRKMHEHAACLLNLSMRHEEIPVAEYERFLHEQRRMRLQMDTLKHELEDEAFNLDALTGAFSRSGMLTRLREQQSLVKRNLESCVIVMMDIDHFKLVNDNYGHTAGDRVLAAFARHVMSNTRPFDRLFRYGGEEFLLCAPHTDIESAHTLIERIRSGLEQLAIENNGDAPLHITASFGMTMLDPDLPVVDSIDRADIATYAAKRAGRNRTMVWDSSMTKAEMGASDPVRSVAGTAG